MVGLAALADSMGSELAEVGLAVLAEGAVLADGAGWGVGLAAVSSLVFRQAVNWSSSLLETSWIRPRPNWAGRPVTVRSVSTVTSVESGPAAAVMDGDRLLLTKRTDNGEWCLPGGAIDSGERPAEAAERETLEETGLVVRVTGLVGVYSNPDVVVVYPDGNRVQVLGVVFRAEIVSGEAGCSAEVSESGWFTAQEAADLTVIAGHRPILPAVFGGELYFDPSR